MEVQINKENAIDISVNSKMIDGKYYSHVAISPPKQVQVRQRVAIICVLDISGSMDCQATQGQSKQSDGFSRLDLVKHSVNTIIHSLQEGDYIGIVTFSNNARTDLELTLMDKNGRDKALDVVKKMKTQGSTNLWDGIKNGLEMAKNPICDSKNTFVVVLSDGQPNVFPPQGNLGALQKYIANSPLRCSLSMFGYGYSLDTKLLSSMSQLGTGCYGYIPDCSMVGTVFVNFLSLALSTFSTLLTIDVQTKKGKLVSLNGQPSSKASMGPVQYGLSRNLLVVHQGVSDEDEFATLKIHYGKNLRTQFDLTLKVKQTGDYNKLKTQTCRWEYINFLHSATESASSGKIKEAHNQCLTLINKMKKVHAESKDDYLQAMIRDMNSPQDQQGQVEMCLKNQQFWNKWGKHYLPALRIAHKIQMCTNFKDPGIQKYCGLLFRQIENNIDTIFIQLPPPQPTIKKYDANGNVKQVQNMANYYNAYGGCIGGDCLVKMANGFLKKVKDLSSNDFVLTQSGPAKVKCVLVTDVNQQIEMVKFKNGLLITNYHPIKHNGKWAFPVDVKPAEKLYIDKYYNFVLEQGHTMNVNGIQCVTLGHGFKGQVIEHSYLGTQAIIRDLTKLTGWQNGSVKVNRNIIRRDPISQLIVGMNV